MCPAHRAKVLDDIKVWLDSHNPESVICISTQLIEAGVDVDFGGVIRYLAGIDSIAQAAGRCNRNGRRSTGRVFIVNPQDENLERLPDIQKASVISKRVLREYHANPDSFDNDLQSPKSMDLFYLYYFYNRAHEMSYDIAKAEIDRDDTLLSLLSLNKLSVNAYSRNHNKQEPSLRLRQSFRSAAENFKVIDTPTEGVIVPYGEEGESIIAKLCAATHPAEQAKLLKKAQRFSVNMFPHEIQALKEKRSIYEVWEGSGIYWLDEQHYSNEFGASVEKVAPMKSEII